MIYPAARIPANKHPRTNNHGSRERCRLSRYSAHFSLIFCSLSLQDHSSIERAFNGLYGCGSVSILTFMACLNNENAKNVPYGARRLISALGTNRTELSHTTPPAQAGVERAANLSLAKRRLFLIRSRSRSGTDTPCSMRARMSSFASLALG